MHIDNGKLKRVDHNRCAVPGFWSAELEAQNLMRAQNASKEARQGGGGGQPGQAIVDVFLEPVGPSFFSSLKLHSARSPDSRAVGGQHYPARGSQTERPATNLPLIMVSARGARGGVTTRILHTCRAEREVAGGSGEGGSGGKRLNTSEIPVQFWLVGSKDGKGSSSAETREGEGGGEGVQNGEWIEEERDLAADFSRFDIVREPVYIL